MDRVRQDLVYVLRAIARNPGFAAIAILTLALGIGADSAVFSVINGVLLRPLAFDQPDRLVFIWSRDLKGEWSRGPFKAAEFEDLRQETRSFEQLAAIDSVSFNLIGGDQPQRVQGARVSPNFLELLGARPLLGRSFLPDESAPGSGQVLILGHELWRSQFGADPGVLGKTVTLRAASTFGPQRDLASTFTIVGVMPKSFRVPIFDAELWIPLALGEAELSRQNGTPVMIIGRIESGLRVDQAESDVDSIAARLASQYPQTNSDKGAQLEDFEHAVVGDIRPSLLMLLAAVGMVLLIACGNVANLLVARALSRQKEMAVRLALGAGRIRIVRMLITESLVFSISGGALGVLMGVWAKDLLVAGLPGYVGNVKGVSIDGRVLAFSLATSMLTGLVFGLAPGLKASKPDLGQSLKDGARTSAGASQSRIRNALIIGEVGLSVMLLIGAGLMIRSFIRIHDIDLGFDPQNVLVMRVSLPESQYRSDEQVKSFYTQLLERAASLPGVKSAGVANILPLSTFDASTFFMVENRPASPAEQAPLAGFRSVSPGYIEAMGISIAQGRGFVENDLRQKNAIVNESLAKQYWPGENLVGRRIKLGPPDSPNRWIEVVGIAKDIKHVGMPAERPTLYYPSLAYPSTTLSVRTGAAPRAVAAALVGIIHSIDKDQPAYDIETMEDRLSDWNQQPRFRTLLMVIFAAAALVLAIVGFYGVMTYFASQRTREIGIRIALGASSADVLRYITGRALMLAGTGVVIGLGGALAVSRLISGLLYEVSDKDPGMYIGAAALMTLVALLASLVPARRATRLDPAVALRHE